MVAVAQLSARGVNILRTLRATFAALEEHGKSHPDEVDELAASIASHIRSWRPYVLTAAEGPVLSLRIPATIAQCTEIERALGDDHRYRIATHVADGENFIVLSLSDGDENVLHAFTLPQVDVLSEDIKAIKSAFGGDHG